MGALALPGEPPLALISTCCGASTFAYDFTKVLMEAAGVPLIQTEKELNKKQPMRTALESLNLTADISVPEGLAALYQESRRRSKYLLFVGEARNDRWLSYLQPEFTASLAQLRARTVLLYRNPLDLFLCRVNDCFEHSGVAEPVFRNGTRSRLCFARRKAREPQLVEEQLHRDAFKMHTGGLNEYLLAHGLGEDHAIPMFAVEELAAFEYEETAGALTDLAINQWRLLLNTFGVTLRPQAIQTEMQRVVSRMGPRVDVPYSDRLWLESDNAAYVAGVKRLVDRFGYRRPSENATLLDWSGAHSSWEEQSLS